MCSELKKSPHGGKQQRLGGVDRMGNLSLCVCLCDAAGLEILLLLGP